MKTIPIIFVILLFVSCQSDEEINNEQKPFLNEEKINNQPKLGTSSTIVITGLSFPEWIKGEWHNSAESNTNNFVFYSFYENQLTITHGVSFKNGHEMKTPYEKYSINERKDDSTYIVNLEKEKHSISYEFKLRKFDWTEEPVLTYSISENGELKRDHLTSIQLVLTKR